MQSARSAGSLTHFIRSPMVRCMRIFLLPQRREIDLDGRRRVGDILRHLGLLPGTVMVIRNDELITEQDVVGADEHIEIRSVISGG